MGQDHAGGRMNEWASEFEGEGGQVVASVCERRGAGFGGSGAHSMEGAAGLR